MIGALGVNLVRLARRLRANGLPVGAGAAAEMAEALSLVGFESRQDVYSALAAVTLTDESHRPGFDEAFNYVFGSQGPEESPIIEWTVTGVGVERVPVLYPGDDLDVGDSDAVGIEGASALERLSSRDFADLDPEERRLVKRMMAQMSWSPAPVRSRRWQASKGGARPDRRRTMRALASPEADLMRLRWATRKQRPRPVVVLADVSGSMERYTEMLLYFLHAAQGRLGRVESFVFATRLTRISRPLRRRDPRVALAEVAAAVDDWSGGTRIGDSIASFNTEWSRRVTGGGAVALVISDGWDTGDPDLLATEVARLARSVHRLVWLNPLSGRPGYAPEARGMSIALRHVDDFLPAANLTDLRDLVRHLVSLPSRKGVRR